jgi:predicted nicotinamide N-methyase
VSAEKKSHPALSFAKAHKRCVSVGGDTFEVWMAPDMDALLEDFIHFSQQDAQFHDKRCPFGAVLWPSARALWEWLCAQPKRFEELAAPIHLADFRVIELGAGVGFLSALLSKKTKWTLLTTDYEPAYGAYLEANCKLLGAKAPPFQTLDWCETAPEPLAGQFDLVIACDVLYDDTHIENLPRIAAQLLKPHGALILADPERYRFETALQTLGKHFQIVTKHPTRVQNSTDDSFQSGVVNADQKQTRVQIVHCQKPLI